MNENYEVQKNTEFISLATELSVEISGERFPFPGIDPDAYLKLKAVDAEYPGYTTPTDELITRLENEGFKITLGPNPESGNVFILPADSDNLEQDSLFPRHLKIDPTMDVRLQRLISLSQSNS